MKIIGNSIARDNPIFSTQRISVSCKNNCWPPTSWLRQRSAPEQATGKWNASENVRNKKKNNREWDRGTSNAWGREKQNPFAHTCMCTATHEGYLPQPHHSPFPAARIVSLDFLLPLPLFPVRPQCLTGGWLAIKSDRKIFQPATDHQDKIWR